MLSPAVPYVTVLAIACWVVYSRSFVVTTANGNKHYRQDSVHVTDVFVCVML